MVGNDRREAESVDEGIPLDRTAATIPLAGGNIAVIVGGSVLLSCT